MSTVMVELEWRGLRRAFSSAYKEQRNLVLAGEEVSQMPSKHETSLPAVSNEHHGPAIIMRPTTNYLGHEELRTRAAHPRHIGPTHSHVSGIRRESE